jgi:hypothetical protein
MKHYTKYEDTNIAIELSCYEKYTHDEYCRKNQLTGELITPFRVAYIDLVTNNKSLASNSFGTKTDNITAFVNIAMIDNIIPELVFDVVDVRVASFLSKSYIDEVLRFITEGIRHNEITWLNNMDFSNVNSGIPISPLTANYSPS